MMGSWTHFSRSFFTQKAFQQLAVVPLMLFLGMSTSMFLYAEEPPNEAQKNMEIIQQCYQALHHVRHTLDETHLRQRGMYFTTTRLGSDVTVHHNMLILPEITTSSGNGRIWVLRLINDNQLDMYGYELDQNVHINKSLSLKGLEVTAHGRRAFDQVVAIRRSPNTFLGARDGGRQVQFAPRIPTNAEDINNPQHELTSLPSDNFSLADIYAAVLNDVSFGLKTLVERHQSLHRTNSNLTQRSDSQRSSLQNTDLANDHNNSLKAIEACRGLSQLKQGPGRGDQELYDSHAEFNKALSSLQSSLNKAQIHFQTEIDFARDGLSSPSTQPLSHPQKEQQATQ